MRRILLPFIVAALFTNAWADPFPKEDRDRYMTGCKGGSEVVGPYCECTLSKLEETMTLDEFRALRKLKQKELFENQKFWNSTQVCMPTYK